MLSAPPLFQKWKAAENEVCKPCIGISVQTPETLV